MQSRRATLSTILNDRRFESDAADHRFNQAPDEALFTALCEAYAPFGGVARGDNLARLLDDWTPADANLARLIAARDIFHFQWRGSQWIPMAQFHLQDLSLNLAVREVRRELGDRVDGWEAASWFVRAHDRLNGRRPIDLVSREPFVVVQAARADRLIGLG